MSETSGVPERFPLSFQHDFLRMMDRGDGTGPFGPRYVIVGGWRVHGEIDLTALRGAAADVVERHEALRTRVVLDENDPHQVILPPVSPELRECALDGDADRDTVADLFLNEIEAGEFGAGEQPLVRFLLGRFDERDAVLAFVAHHTAVDGWSAQVLVRDLVARYAARRDGAADGLPAVRQMRDYVAWQHENADSPAVHRAREFWRENLRGGRVVAMRTDLPRSPDATFLTSWHRYTLEPEFSVATVEMAAETRSSVFMVLLAAYLTYLRDETGESDLVVPTFTPGRHPTWTQESVGYFFNFLPLRVDLTGCADFREVVAKTRAACVSAYTHEIPFSQIIAEAPELMNAVMEPYGAACVFQAVQSPFTMTDEEHGGVRWTAIRRRLRSAPVGTQIPNGALWSLELDPAGDILGKFGFNTNLFHESTITGTADGLRRTLRETLVEPYEIRRRAA
ncbi:condensation domain-containing protein [Amycolatopsis sp. TRM77291]